MFSRTAIHNRIMDAIHPQLNRAHRLEDDLRKPFLGTGRHRADGNMALLRGLATAMEETA